MSTPHTPESQSPAPHAEAITQAYPTTPFPELQAQQIAQQAQQQQQQAQQQQQQAQQQHAQQQAQAQQTQQQQHAATNQTAYRSPVQSQTDRGTTMGGTNTFAFLAIIFAFIAPLAGIILGHMGLSQIKRNGDAGRGIALTGLIISYASFLLVALVVISYMVLMFSILGIISSSVSSFSDYPMPS